MTLVFDPDLSAQLAQELLEDAAETSDSSSFVWSSGAARQAGEQLTAAMEELRERRAADLTSADVEALEFARGLLRCIRFQADYPVKQQATALAALDKLIARASR